MLRNKALVGVLVLMAVAAGAGSAGAQQAISLNVGWLYVRGENSRVAGDTLVANLSADYPFALGFRIQDFNAPTIGFEWLYPIGKYLEVGAGVGYYARTNHSFYADLAHPDGSDILQDLRLRVIPVTAVVRYMPFGRRTAAQPYVGAGLGVLVWRYSETGDFVDGDQNIFSANFVGSGTALGPLVLGGLRIPAGHNFAVGLEARYQRASAPLSADFLGSRIDLGGTTLQANFVLRF